MAIHNEIGKLGETLAVEYFVQMGYRILYKNWRHKHWEVDLIAESEGILHFIEVKTKSSNHFGYPEEEVSRNKLQKLINASEAFLRAFPEWQNIQFDILAITLNPSLTYFLLEDVYL